MSPHSVIIPQANTAGTAFDEVVLSGSNLIVQFDSTGSLVAAATSTVTSSYSLTSSYAINSSTTLTASSLLTGGNYNITSLTASIISASSFTGSHFGTSSWSSNSLNSTSASYSLNSNASLSASYIDGGGITTGTIVNGRLPSQISVTGITASFTGSHTGSLLGTASWSSNTITASYSMTASYISGSDSVSSSYSISSSYSLNSNSSLSASYIDGGGITTGTVLNARLPSQINVVGVTASFTGSHTGSLLGTASWSNNSLNSTSASYSLNSNSSLSASYIDGGAITTGTVLNGRLPSQISVVGVTASFTGSVTGSLLGTASWSSNTITATSASYSLNSNASLSASYIDGGGITTGTILNGRLPSQISVVGVTASFTGSVTGSLLGTASWATTAITANALATGNSYVITNLTASGGISASGTSSFGMINIGYIATASAKFHLSGSNTNENEMLIQNGSGSNLFFISSSGNIGINTIVPVSMFEVVGNISASSFTGSHFGTSSWSSNALNSTSASYSLNSNASLSASYIDGGGITTGTVLNARLPSQISVVGVTASFTGSHTGSLLGTASWSSNSLNSTSASYSLNSNSSLSASYIDGGGITTGTVLNTRLPSQVSVTGITASFTGSHTGSLLGTASWAINSATSSYMVTSLNAISSSYLSGSNGIVDTFTVVGLLNASQISGSQVYITSSNLTVTSNILTLNANSPHLRYAGIQMYDSGSSDNLAALLWDGNSNYLFFSSSDAGYSRKFITGPDNEGNLTSGSIPLNISSNGLVDSIITQSGTVIGIAGTLNVINITGSHFGTSSWSSNSLNSTSASYSLNSNSSLSASYIDGGGITTGTVLNARLSSQISVVGVTASFTGSVTGSLLGTASWSSNSLNSTSASYSLNSNASLSASYIDGGGITTGTVLNARLPSQISVVGVTASFTGSVTGSLLGTASWSSNALNSTSASYSLNSNASLSASYIDGGGITTGTILNGRLPSQILVTGITASFTGSVTGSLLGTASWSSNSLNSTSASYALTSSFASNGLFITSSNITASGMYFELALFQTSSYNNVFYDYGIISSSNSRCGTIFGCWNSGSIVYSEVSTIDIGNTSDVSMSLDISASKIRLLAYANSIINWNIKSSARYL